MEQKQRPDGREILAQMKRRLVAFQKLARSDSLSPKDLAVARDLAARQAALVRYQENLIGARASPPSPPALPEFKQPAYERAVAEIGRQKNMAMFLVSFLAIVGGGGLLFWDDKSSALVALFVIAVLCVGSHFEDRRKLDNALRNDVEAYNRSLE
jgi:hypothetical protein